MKYVSIAEFEEKCLEFFDGIKADGESITVLKDGKAYVLVEAVRADDRREGQPIPSIIGCAREDGTTDDAADPETSGWDEPWNAEKGVVFNDEEQEREYLEYEARRQSGQAA